MLLRVFILCFLFTNYIQAQISPPGLDNTKLVTWGAIGFKQQIAKKITINVYAGGSRESDPDNVKTLTRNGILVLNQETYYAINHHWQIAFCTSFRAQNFYSPSTPYNADNPAYRNEIRYYTRLFYKHKAGRFSMAYSFRPEYRTYYTPSWKIWTDKPLELRFRYKAQISTHLNAAKTNFFTIANEVLTATDHNIVNNHSSWSPYQFTEDRVTTYFKHVFKSSVVVDIGLMHQFLKTSTGKLTYIAYLAFDVVFQNPFTKKKSVVLSKN